MNKSILYIPHIPILHVNGDCFTKGSFLFFRADTKHNSNSRRNVVLSVIGDEENFMEYQDNTTSE